MFKVKCNGKTIEVGNVEWSDSLDSLGTDFSFDYAYGSFDSQFKDQLKNGDIITMFNGNDEIMRGIITTIPIGDSNYSGHDFAFYLNKSECVIQFKKIAADKAIKQLLARFDVPIGSICAMPTNIKKVYKDQIVGDVIVDILKQVRHETGKHHRIEMKKGKFYISEYNTIKIKPYYIDELGKKVSCTKSAKISGTRSIEDLKNQITVCGNGEKATQIKSIAKSSSSIKKYGLLSEVVTKENVTTSKAKNTAKNELAEMNKVATSFTAEMHGSFAIKSGRLIYFDRPEVKVKGWYKVKSCTHAYNNLTHWISCEMERV